MTDKFQVTYQANDGYVSGNRPKYFTIDDNELYGLETEQDVRNFFNEAVEDDFRASVIPVTKDEDRFVEWAMQKIKEQEEDEDRLVERAMQKIKEQEEGL